ncbi:MAG: cobalt ECF transporter T component CbiQ [Pseudomonadota bacterium]
MIEISHIELPLWQLPVFILIPVAFLTVTIAVLRRIAYKQSVPEEERDWSVPAIDGAISKSPFYLWDVRFKIVTILVFSFIIASLKNLTSALVAICISSLVLLVARVSFSKTLLRLLAISGFISMFFIVMPLSVPVHSKDTLIVFGNIDWLVFNLRGLLLAATIAGKAIAITLLMEPLLSTAPLPVTLHGLSRLGVPEMAGQMVLLSYRYLHVFRHEAKRMSSGMHVRGFKKHTNMQTLRALSNFLGMLLVRSFERTERVFDAMRARGYKGRFPEPAGLKLKTSDIVISAIWLAAGIALIIYDRIICYTIY